RILKNRWLKQAKKTAGARHVERDRKRGGGVGVPAATRLRSELDRPRRDERFRALEHCGAAELANSAAGAAGGADSLHAAADRLSFSAPGAGHANRAEQSDADRPRAGADLFSDAACGRGHLPGRRGAVSAGTGGRDGSGRAGLAPAAAPHAPVSATKRRGVVPRPGAGAATGGSGRCANAGGGARLHSVGAEDGISDWSGAVPALSGDRCGGGGGDDFDRHDAVAAGDHFDSAENFAVRDGGWLESAAGVADEEFYVTSLGYDERRDDESR